jgi:hypothetical protein
MMISSLLNIGGQNLLEVTGIKTFVKRIREPPLSEEVTIGYLAGYFGQ